MLEIGSKLKELRKSKKVTQKVLAEHLNVTPQAISKWERNESNPDLEMLIKLSNYFNISVDQILGIKKKSIFDSLYYKMEGRFHMKKEVEKIEHLNLKEDVTTDTIMIFDIVFSLISDSGLMQTMFLANKMNNLLKKRGSSVTVESYSSNLLEKKANQAAIIMLTPTYGYAKEEIEKKFPGTPVIAISKKDYGIVNAEKLITESLNILET